MRPHVQEGDVVIVSSKAAARVEGRIIDLQKITPSDEAKTLAKKCHQDPRFTETVMDETKRMNGQIAGTCPWALLTSLKPTGMKEGRILCPNAGLDQSNVEEGFAIGWPEDPVASTTRLRQKLIEFTRKGTEGTNGTDGAEVRQKNSSVPSLAVILSDSCCKPGRRGVTAFALAASGIDPLLSQVGRSDLFGKKLKFTHEATVDQLAVAGNAVMGNADQATPAAIIREHGIPLSQFSGWVEGIDRKDDLFGELMSM